MKIKKKVTIFFPFSLSIRSHTFQSSAMNVAMIKSISDLDENQNGAGCTKGNVHVRRRIGRRAQPVGHMRRRVLVALPHVVFANVVRLAVVRCVERFKHVLAPGARFRVCRAAAARVVHVFADVEGDVLELDSQRSDEIGVRVLEQIAVKFFAIAADCFGALGHL